LASRFAEQNVYSNAVGLRTNRSEIVSRTLAIGFVFPGQSSLVAKNTRGNPLDCDLP